MPQGSKRGENWNFYDHTYDGLWEGNILRNGLGQLIDGRGGPADFKEDYYGHERGWFVFNSSNSTQGTKLLFKCNRVDRKIH